MRPISARSFPWLLPPVLLLGLAGCPAGGNADRAPPGHLLGDDAEGGPRPAGVPKGTADRAVRIEVAEADGLPSKARLLFASYAPDQLSDGRPRFDATPGYFWVSKKVSIKGGSFELDVPLPVGLDLLVTLDVDGDKKPGVGDRTSDLLTGYDPSAGPIRIDRSFVGGGDGGGGGGVLTTGPERRVRLEGKGEATRVEKAKILVAGFREGDLRGGFPAAGRPPRFFWSTGKKKLKWPMELDLQLPPEPVDLVVLLDADGDGLPSPGDPISSVQPKFVLPAEGASVTIAIDRVFNPDRGRLSNRPQERAGDAGAGLAVRMIIDAEPAVPVKEGATVMIVSYDEDDLSEEGMPREGAKPTFLWTRAEPQVNWPLRVDARMPTDSPVLVMLDLDGDERPSAGDLVSEPEAEPVPESGQPEVSFVLDRVLEPARD